MQSGVMTMFSISDMINELDDDRREYARGFESGRFIDYRFEREQPPYHLDVRTGTPMDMYDQDDEDDAYPSASCVSHFPLQGSREPPRAQKLPGAHSISAPPHPHPHPHPHPRSSPTLPPTESLLAASTATAAATAAAAASSTGRDAIVAASLAREIAGRLAAEEASAAAATNRFLILKKKR